MDFIHLISQFCQFNDNFSSEITPAEPQFVFGSVHFPGLNSSVGGAGTLQSRNGPAAFHHCYFSIKNKQTIKPPIIPCWEVWLSFAGETTMVEGSRPIPQLQNSHPNHRGLWTWKMYASKQIKICVEYRDMLPRPRWVLSGTPGLRHDKPALALVACPCILHRS